MYELLNDMVVVQRINNQRLRCLGHVVRIEDQIVEALSSIGVTNWRRRARRRDAWKDLLRQAEIR